MTLEKCTLGWHNLYALFTASPPYTAIHNSFNEKWTLTDHLLATQLDRLNILVWTKTKDAHRKPPRNMPKRIPRPGVDERPKPAHLEGTVTSIERFIRLQEESGRTAKMANRGRNGQRRN